MWSFLYIVLIALAVAELGLVAWTVNFLRRYAFRPNAVPTPTQGWRIAGAYHAPRRAANQAGEPLHRQDEAKRR